MIIRYFKSITFLVFIMTFITLAAHAEEVKGIKGPGYVPQKLLVKFYPEVTDEKKATIRKELGADLIKCVKEIGVEVWKLPDNLSIEDAVKKLKKDKSIEYSGPENKYNPQTRQNDSKLINSKLCDSHDQV